MKGVILAGGTGSRLRPLTYVTNKHLLPMYDRPMIYWSIQTLRDAGITDILIISGKDHAGHFLNLLRSGKQLGVNLTYEVQEEAGGIAQAIGLAQDFADEGPVAVLLGDNLIEENLKEAIAEFTKKPAGAKVFLSKVEHPEWYGVVAMDGEKITKIVEKPKTGEEPSNLAVIGLYLYGADVFTIVPKLKPSARGELEVTDINNAYLKLGKLQHAVLTQRWADTGESFDTFFHAQALARAMAQREKK